MHIVNARLRTAPGLHSIFCQNGQIQRIAAQGEAVPAPSDALDAAGNLLIAPLVEPHIHLDAVATAGQPEWNRSGTLFEGIERWGQRKATITHDDTKARAHAGIKMLAEHGIQQVRTHVDVTDSTLAALKALLEVRDEARSLIDLQIVAFPQEGIESFEGGRALMERALDMGADVVGGIPHFENTREQGVSSIHFLMDLAERRGLKVDVHCDETDDPHSRFLEVLAEQTRVRGMGAQVTASHTTAMGSYDNAYCSKLMRLLRAANLSFVSCPTESIHLQGRFDTFPKRRGVTRVAELDRAGLNVCFGQDSLQDPWYPLGNGNILRILDAGLHICHMMGYDDLRRCLDLVTDHSARALGLGDGYGIAEGRPASFVILEAPDDYEAVRTQAKALWSVRKGQVIMQRAPQHVQLLPSR